MNFLGILAGWKGLALMAVACLTIGFTAGWKVKSWQVDSEGKDQQQQTMRQDAKNQANADVKNQKLGAVTDQVERQTQQIEKEIERALPAAPKPPKRAIRAPLPAAAAPIVVAPSEMVVVPVVTPAAPVLDCAVPVLPVGVVGLLNRSLDQRAPDPAGWSEGEKQAPSDVGLRELSLKLNEVAGQYHDLAARHDALVDWVDEEVKKSQQARQ